MSQKNRISARRKDSISPPVTITVYYWHRIILFGLLVIFVIGGMGFWAFTQFNITAPSLASGKHTETETRFQASDRIKTADKDEQSALISAEAKTPVLTARTDDRPAEPAQTDIVLASATADMAVSSVDPVPQPEIQQDMQPAIQSDIQDNNDLIGSMDSQVVAEDEPPTRVETVSERSQANDALSVTASRAPASSDELTSDSRHSKPVTTEIFSEAIMKASLARALQDHEPVDNYEQAVNLDGNNLITVYMFTQTQGYVGETLFHNWYLDNERIAQVTIKPWITPMRASSSKKITAAMIGDWRVDIVDANGKTLAVTSFQVIDSSQEL